MEKEQYYCWAVFNRDTKEFVAFSLSENVTQGKTLVHKLTSSEPINLKDVRWEGDFDTGRAYDSTKRQGYQEPVSETVLEQRKYERLFRKYPPSEIFSTILNQLRVLKHLGIIPPQSCLPEFNELVEFSGKVEARYARDMEFFEQSKSHTVVTKEEAQEKFDDTFKVVPPSEGP